MLVAGVSKRMTNRVPGAPMVVVAAVIRDERGRVLLARRLPRGFHGGLWEFPGGKVEKGETLQEALVREIREELDLEVCVGEPIREVDHAYPHARIRLVAFACTVRAGVPRPLHCQELAWVVPSDLSVYPMPEADRPVAAVLQGAGGARGVAAFGETERP